MFGAILGDIIGSPYEFDRGDKTKDFPLFGRDSYFTDDTIMTVAVADAFLKTEKDDNAKDIKDRVSKSLLHWGRKYPFAGYGTRFLNWLYDENPTPYDSFGNGSAMRVSPVAWLFDDMETVLKMAETSADVTHNHPEGIKGAQATAAAILLARQGKTKEEIKEFIEVEFGYDLSRSCDEIRPFYRHVESCMETVPEAITAFLEGDSFEDVIRTAVSLGGDCDTLTAIAGSIAEGYYGVPEELKRECHKRLNRELDCVLNMFDGIVTGKIKRGF